MEVCISTAIFDSLKYYEKLKDAGFTEAQAKAQANAIREIIDEKLATKKDREAVRTELSNEMQKMELRLSVKLGGMTAASIAIVAALVKIL